MKLIIYTSAPACARVTLDQEHMALGTDDQGNLKVQNMDNGETLAYVGNQYFVAAFHEVAEVEPGAEAASGT